MTKIEMFELEFAVVAGRGSFPFDMLRYDRCSPFRGEETSRLEREDGSRALIVVRYAGQPGQWTDARWSSFGWGLRRFGKDQGAAQDWCRQLTEQFQIGKEVVRG
jgi:hypothetical protein